MAAGLTALGFFPAAAKAIVPAGDHQTPAIHEAGRELPTRAFVNLGDRGTGNIHLCGTLLVSFLFQVYQAEHFILV